MKFVIAIMAIVSATNAVSLKAEPVWSLESVNVHRDDSTVQKAYGDYSTEQANARPPL